MPPSVFSPGCLCEPSIKHWRRLSHVPASARSELDVAMSVPVRRLNTDAQSALVFSGPFCLANSAPHDRPPRPDSRLGLAIRLHCSNIRNFPLFSRAQRQKAKAQEFGGLIRQFRSPPLMKQPHILPQLEMHPLLSPQLPNIGRSAKIGPSSALGVGLVTSMKTASTAARITCKQHDALCATLSSTIRHPLLHLLGTLTSQTTLLSWPSFISRFSSCPSASSTHDHRHQLLKAIV